MDANDYHLLRNGKNVLDFSTLKETEKCLLEAGHNQLAQTVSQLLLNNGIGKPVYHNAIDGPSDYYRVDLAEADIELIISMFFDMEVSALTTNFETTPAASHYASLLDKWNELIVE